ncbi:C2 domain-containing protein 3 [Diachasma alloeum]|uniref:C2 domain-containing protein 3 n=1 Tax=Diachasma alloeum TaxID=454923 RepID=UPI00073833CD|nr:C2 domain-containing protein 3 [Diachasma alloeum]
MDLDVVTRSLPPLVKGKIHGYLKLVISEVIWHRTRPGDVTVIASWWGETDSAHFRPVDPTMDSTRAASETTETYAVRTNFDLFEEYLTNCGTVDLLIISEPLNEIVGTAQISDLHEIFRGKSYIQYCSIINKVGTKIGDIPVSLTLSKAQRSPRKLKDKKSALSSLPDNDLPEPDLNFALKNPLPHRNTPPTSEKESYKPEENIYRSILKEKRFSMNRTAEKSASKVTDKLVAQVVARAQKLRGVLMKETKDDFLETNENSLDSYRSENDPEDPDAALYKYFMGSSLSRKDEKRALEKLRSTSPTPSLIDIATETIVSCRDDKTSDRSPWSRRNTEELPDPLNEEISSNRLTVHQKEATPMDYVDSLRIAVESLSLTPAGYRRVKSSCLTRGDGLPTSVTYFVQYDAAFANVKKYNKKVINESKKPVKISSRRQDGQIIQFNHEAVYNLPRSHVHLQMNMPLRFKIFNRHLEQRTPTELGVGSIYIGDAAKSPHLNSTQKLAIVKKGIKIGELKVTIELGCDKIHFGRQFIEAVTMAKENIPVLELSHGAMSNLNRYKCTTGNESKPSGTNTGVTPVPDQRQCYSRHEGSGQNSSASRREISEKTEERLKTDVPALPEEKTLLHGLIHIVEGRNLPAMNTYIICRALWRQDKSSSRVCTDTTNPHYNFHQIMPLIYGLELLERTKDNCIITEVYSKSLIGEDNLIGISKLSVHQLYVAFRDPLVLPNLLKSRYPVISVDGWVLITDPVTGRLCGELSALVALGTADQIALLEMTRDLRGRNSPEDSPRRSLNHHREPSRESSVRTQECQTEISTVSDIKSADSRFKMSEELRGEQTAVLHTIVDKLAQALTAPRIITNQEAQTEFQVPTRESDLHVEMNPNSQVLSSNPSNSNSFSGDSFNEGPRDNFVVSREIYRSVGVGAEFSEPADQNNQAVNVDDYSSTPASVGKRVEGPSSSKNDIPPRGKGREDSVDDSEDGEGFRAVIEIECALHLPTVELSNGSVEPNTYVTFQKLPGGRHERTDVCPYSCNPRYDWRCDTKLSTELLTNEKMRLIMKVWRLLDAEADGTINQERDIVIGFSAIDLSVLTAGFPVVSGWFHINDFSGKSNGQLKVSVTPLDNISSFSRCGGTSRVQAPLDHSNFSSPYPEDLERIAGGNDIQTGTESSEECPQIPAESAFDIALGLGDASMSFLSSSLKQKLTELDEIKQRLQSRLLDVTSTAFEDDFDNDFDFIEGEADPEGDDNNGNSWNIEASSRLAPADNSSTENGLVNNRITNGNGEVMGEIESNKYPQGTSDNNTNTLEANLTDTGYSSGSNVQQTVTNGHRTEQRVFEIPQNINPLINGQHEDQGYPARGTRMHISHLLDKLSMQLTTAPAPIGNLPMKRNIMDLISSLRRNNNNFSNDIKCNRQANVRTVPTQTDTNFISNTQSNNSEVKTETKRNNSTFSNEEDPFKEDEIPAKTQKREKVSTIVREELINDDQNDSSEYDELSTHLMTSNIRHMNSNDMVNPLLYRHALPDISDLPDLPEVHATGQESSSPSLTPDDDTLERLDSRYSESFSATINKSLGRLRNFLDGESTSQVPRLSPTTESTELFRVTPSGVPENTDGNIDVTVIHKPCNDELMASNSMESTTTVSGDNTMRTGTEIDDNSSLNSESSVSAVSRQAPDGGNTVEDPGRPALMKGRENSQDSSAGN